MTIPDTLCHFAFKIYGGIVQKSAENAIFSPYNVFFSSLIFSNIFESSESMKYIGFPDGIDLLTIATQCKKIIERSETRQINSQAFIDMLESISTKKDVSFKYLKVNEQHVMLRHVKNTIIDMFPDLLFINDETVFSRFKDFYEDNKDDERMPQFFKAIEIPIATLRKAPNVFFPNIVYVSSDDIIPKIQETCNTLGIQIKKVSFQKSGIDEINSEFDSLTHGFASQIVSPIFIRKGMKALNVNSMLFEAKWEHFFQSVQMKDFHLYSGKVRKIKTMIMRLTNALYFENDTIQVLQLNYAAMPYSIVFFLNKNAKSVQISDDEFNSAISSLHETDVYIEIPRFEAEFGPSAINLSFSNSETHKTNNQFQIVQKVRFGNYEEGTFPTSEIQNQNVEKGNTSFICNHPFLFFVRNHETNALFLMGTITDPIAVDLKPLTDFEKGENFLASIRGEELPFKPQQVEKEELPEEKQKEENNEKEEIDIDNSKSIQEHEKNEASISSQNKDDTYDPFDPHAIWNKIEKMSDEIQEKQIQKYPNLNDPVESKPQIDDSDIRDFIYSKKNSTRKVSKSEMDKLFGYDDKIHNTFPSYSPWSNVVFNTPKSAYSNYEVLKKSKYPRLPPLPSLSDLTNTEIKTKPSYPSAQARRKPKILEPQVYSYRINSLRESTRKRH